MSWKTAKVDLVDRVRNVVTNQMVAVDMPIPSRMCWYTFDATVKTGNNTSAAESNCEIEGYERETGIELMIELNNYSKCN